MRVSALSAFTFLLLAGVLLLWGCTGKDYDWEEQYIPDSKAPYGGFLVKNLLRSYFPGQHFTVLKNGQESLEKDGNYVFIGFSVTLDEEQTTALLEFVERGNNILIACEKFPAGLLKTLDQKGCLASLDEEFPDPLSLQDHSLTSTEVVLNFDHPDLKDTVGYAYEYLFNYIPQVYNWKYFPKTFFCKHEASFTPLGSLQGEVNFVKATYGKGVVYLHATPLVFTNLFLAKKSGLEYASKVFSHFEPGTMYWEERKEKLFDDYAEERNWAKDTFLSYILSQRSLAWAWYILLSMALLFLIFQAKRRQRIIPVLEQNTNTSLEFIRTIGRLLFVQNDHKQLILQNMKLFLGFVRDRYHLPTRDLDAQFVQSLAARSGVPEQKLDKLLSLHRNITSATYVSKNALVELHQKLEAFYRDCK